MKKEEYNVNNIIGLEWYYSKDRSYIIKSINFGLGLVISKAVLDGGINKESIARQLDMLNDGTWKVVKKHSKIIQIY